MEEDAGRGQEGSIGQEGNMRQEGIMSGESHSGQSDVNPDAKFLGWQKTGTGEFFAIYNVTAPNHPSRGSTVSEKGLEKLHLHVPRTEPLQGERMP